MTSITTAPSDSYPLPFIIEPLTSHKNTIILLHGTSTTGPEFAETFMAFPFTYISSRSSSPEPRTTASIVVPATMSSDKTTHKTTAPLSAEELAGTRSTKNTSTLQSHFPSTRWVFLTGKSRPTTVFNGKLTNAWFDIHTFADRTVGEEDQAIGISESTTYLATLITTEVSLLPADGKIILGGFSQGTAMSLSLLLSGILTAKGLDQRITGWVGMSGWMPFRAQLSNSIQNFQNWTPEDKRIVVARMLNSLLNPPPVLIPDGPTKIMASLGMPMYITQGVDDVKVKMEWSRQMSGLLGLLGAREGGQVERVEMEGVGHWYGEVGMIGLVKFLEKIL